MKKVIVLLSVMLILSVGVFAQSKPDYSGEWTLRKDESKSNSKTDSVTIKAAQSASEIKVEVATKLAAQAENSDGSSGNKQVRRVIGDGTTVYNLDGAESTVMTDSLAGKAPLKLKANFESDGKLNLNSERVIKTPGGDISIITKEIWELIDGGKTLKITREVKTPSGAKKGEMFYTKK